MAQLIFVGNVFAIAVTVLLALGAWPSSFVYGDEVDVSNKINLSSGDNDLFVEEFAHRLREASESEIRDEHEHINTHAHSHVHYIDSEPELPESEFDFATGMATVMDELVVDSVKWARHLWKKCDAVGIPIPYGRLEEDLLDCFKNVVAIVVGKAGEIWANIILRHEEVDDLVSDLLEVVENFPHEPLPRLSLNQKRFIKNTVLEPLCSVVEPAMTECDKPKYETLFETEPCWTEFNRQHRQLIWTLLDDVCRDDGDWILDLLDTDPLACTSEIMEAVVEKVGILESIYMPFLTKFKDPLGGNRKVDSMEELCGIAEMFGWMTTELLIKPCKYNPRLGEIIMNTFKNTREFFTEKCQRAAAPGLTGYWTGALDSESDVQQQREF